MTQQKPSIGRILHLIGPHAGSNGADVAPAIITRVWSDDMVNVTVFPDSGAPHSVTSVRIAESEGDAHYVNERAEHPQSLAFWPPRV